MELGKDNINVNFETNCEKPLSPFPISEGRNFIPSSKVLKIVHDDYNHGQNIANIISTSCSLIALSSISIGLASLITPLFHSYMFLLIQHLTFSSNGTSQIAISKPSLLLPGECLKQVSVL
jgi:hypothetical protein